MAIESPVGENARERLGTDNMEAEREEIGEGSEGNIHGAVDTRHAVKFSSAVVDLREDLDLLLRWQHEETRGMKAILDVEWDDDESDDGYIADCDEELGACVMECQGKNTLDIVFEVPRVLGDVADIEDLCAVAALAGVRRSLAEDLVEEWKAEGVFGC